MMPEYYAYSGWLRETRLDRGRRGARRTSTTATTVTVRDGQRVVTDGPFAETKEHLGGYYLIDAPSLDDAIEAAARVPGANGAARSRSARSRRPAESPGLPAVEPHDGGRPRLPRGARAGDRDADPRPRRLRPRRGGRRRRVRRRRSSAGRSTGSRPTRAPGSRRRPGNRAIDRVRRAAAVRREGAGARAATRRSTRGRARTALLAAAEDEMAPIPDDQLRLIFTCCHPALAPESAVALTLRTLGGLDDPGDRPRLPRPRADARPAAGPGQAEDPRGGDRLRGPGGERLGGPAGGGAAGPVPRVQRGLRRDRRRGADPARAVHRGDPARADRRRSCCPASPRHRACSR